MCGIAGAFTDKPISEEVIYKTIAELKNRGPDSNGFIRRRSKNGRFITLIHTRLSILDLNSRSSQPMSSKISDLIFNGEIYNYLELKSYLKNKNLRTNSDTEILMKLLEEKNNEIFDLIDGMWSFAWFDKRKSELIISRDRFGQKPLLYHQDNNGDLFFASNIKSLKRISGKNFIPNNEKILEFLSFGYKYVFKKNNTFFHEVSYLPSGSFAKFDDAKKLKIKSIWEKSKIVEEEMSYQEAVEGTRKILIQSVERCLRSDVPIAFCLSGGVDSNALISIAKRECGYDVHGYTVMNTNEKYEEKDLVNSTINFLKIKHSFLNVGEGNLLEDLQEAIKGYSGPILNSNYLEHWKLLKLISKDGYKVSVSGTGADELFSGYYDHYLFNLTDLYLKEDMKNFYYEKFLWEKNILPLTRNNSLKSIDKFISDISCRNYIFDNKDLTSKYLNQSLNQKVFDFEYYESKLRNRMTNELFHESVPPIIYQDDSNAMYSSVENRSPFLDYELYKWTLKIPCNYFVRSGLAKSILRDAVVDIADPRICKSSRKVGFNVPIDDLLLETDKSSFFKTIKSDFLNELICKEEFEKLLFKNEKTNKESKFLFSIFSVNSFLNEYL